MARDDAERHRQPETGSLARCLCHQERHEEVRTELGRDAGPVVGDRHPDDVSAGVGHRPLCDDPDRPVFGSRLDRLGRIEGQVDEDLLDLGTIQQYCRDVLGDLHDRLDPTGTERIGLQCEDLIDDSAEGHGSTFRRSLARKVEKAVDDPVGSTSLLDEEIGLVAKLGRQALIRSDQLAEGEDRGQRIVQLVLDARDEQADRLHFLGLEQLLLAPVGARDIEPEKDATELAGSVGNGPDHRVDDGLLGRSCPDQRSLDDAGCPVAPGSEGGPDRFHHGDTLDRPDHKQLVDRPADRFAGGDAMHPFGRRVPGCDDAIGARDHDRLGSLLEDEFTDTHEVERG